MRSTDARPEADPMELVLRGLSLGLRDQANRILRSVPDYYTAYGVLAEARAAIDLIENFLEQALNDDEDETTTESEPAEYEYREGVYL